MGKIKSKNKSFEHLFIKNIAPRYDLHKTFDDFLTMSICCMAINPLTKQSYYEDDFLLAKQHYKDPGDSELFAELFALLTMEMETRMFSSRGNDVLGEFFEKHLASDRKAQFFTPWHICEFIANITLAEVDARDLSPKRMIDPCCGSGRMLVSNSWVLGYNHFYYGIDIDRLCVKMTAINLFLNGALDGEVMCADALNPSNSFVESYKISRKPLRIYKITQKEQSPLWKSHSEMGKCSGEDPALSLIQKIAKSDGIQLHFF